MVYQSDWNLQCKKRAFYHLLLVLSFACLCPFWFFLAFFTITVSEIVGSTVLVQKDV